MPATINGASHNLQTERELALEHEDFTALLFQSVGEIGESEAHFECNFLHFVGENHDTQNRVCGENGSETEMKRERGRERNGKKEVGLKKENGI